MTNPRIALLTANIGNLDSVQIFEPQSIPCDRYVFTDGNLPFPLPNLNCRLKGKYIKIKTHKFLPHYDYYVWVDSRLGIVSNEFVEFMVTQLSGSDVVIAHHSKRANVFEEIRYITEKIKNGDRYLIGRYRNEPFAQEEAFYRQTRYIDWTLYYCGVFARKNTSHVNSAFDDWWDKCIEFTNFDQTQFTYIVNRHALRINALNYDAVTRHLVSQGHGIAAKLPFRTLFTKSFPSLTRTLIGV